MLPDVKAFQGGSRFGKKPLLNFTGDAELFLVLAQFPLGAFAFRNVAHEPHKPSFAAERHVAVANLHRICAPSLRNPMVSVARQFIFLRPVCR